jgi:5-methyltetrahydropteroyltriglutamate--homocysteine methyltransferase
MKRSENRILTTHVGSLIRPKPLLDLALAKQKGEPVDEAEYERVLRESVREVVRQQAAAGVDIVNDGEFGKSSWAAYVLERITGFEIRPDRIVPLSWLGRDRERFREFFAVELFSASSSACKSLIFALSCAFTRAVSSLTIFSSSCRA